ncbi:MAG TPA: 30S ribosome-binding factor RbfA [Burkholderiales bacterium]|jgi:ribosome-binding factor A|nr:30S ribosome-binding factor RbfA [Burkholderiales bacterium]
MKKSANRATRMADQIQKDIMSILRAKVKDPRISWVTVNDVEVANDYSLAKIYYSVLQTEQRDGIAKALESAKGFIRSELSKGLTTYTVPQLKFIFDESLERGSHILSLISKVADEYTEESEAEDKEDEENPQ